MSSRLPPPMSATMVRAPSMRKWWATERQERAASVSASMMRSGMPSSSRTRWTKSSPLEASRTAEVATAAMRRTPRRWQTTRMRASPAMARSMAAESRCPVVATPWARRGWSFTSSTTVRPAPGSYSATSRRIELEPTSRAARRSRPGTAGAMLASGSGRTARVSSVTPAPSAGRSRGDPRRDPRRGA